VQLNLRVRTLTKNLPTVLYPLTSLAMTGGLASGLLLAAGVDAAGTWPVPLTPGVGCAALAHALSTAASRTAASSFCITGPSLGPPASEPNNTLQSTRRGPRADQQPHGQHTALAGDSFSYETSTA
jgi:hypothetical protein